MDFEERARKIRDKHGPDARPVAAPHPLERQRERAARGQELGMTDLTMMSVAAAAGGYGGFRLGFVGYEGLQPADMAIGGGIAAVLAVMLLVGIVSATRGGIWTLAAAVIGCCALAASFLMGGGGALPDGSGGIFGDDTF